MKIQENIIPKMGLLYVKKKKKIKTTWSLEVTVLTQTVSSDTVRERVKDTGVRRHRERPRQRRRDRDRNTK
jgi:hypothetical protein